MNCFSCAAGFEALHAWEEEQMNKYGWFIHFVADDPRAPNRFNAHTHGIKNSFGHPDLQICLAMNAEYCSHFFHQLVRDISNGKQFDIHHFYPDILSGGYLLKFIDAMETGRHVLRLVFPDKNGEYNGEPYCAQLTMMHNHR